MGLIWFFLGAALGALLLVILPLVVALLGAALAVAILVALPLVVAVLILAGVFAAAHALGLGLLLAAVLVLLWASERGQPLPPR